MTTTASEQVPSSENLSTSIYAKMSFLEKLEQVCKLREAAWAIKAAGIKAKRPELSDEEIQKQVKQVFLYAST